MKLTLQDLNLTRARLLQNFSQDDLEQSGWLDRPLDRTLRTQLAELDLEFFARFYLPHHFDCPPAPLHRETYRKIEQALETPGRVNLALVWPRGFGKTTTVTLALVLWCICFKKRRFIPIISDSYPQAKQQLATLKDELEYNTRLLADFGVLKGKKWQEDDITTSTGVKVIALGARMKIRGRKFLQYRPDLIVVDDSENLEGCMSATRREAHREWFLRSLMKSGWSDTKVFVVGNFLHFDCLLKHLEANPLFRTTVYQAVTGWAERQDLWDTWRAVLTDPADDRRVETAYAYFKLHKEEMLEGAVSAWPEAFPYYDLMVVKVADGDAAFATELQNEPVDPERRLFKSWGTFRMEWRVADSSSLADESATVPAGDIWLIPTSGAVAVPLRSCALFGYTDPSMGGTIHADRSAVMVLAKSRLRQMFVLVADIKRRPPDQIIVAQNKYASEYPITKWGIERNAFQALFATESARRSMEAGVYLPVTPINQLANKALRINSLQPDLENHYLLIREDGQLELKAELEQWPMGRYDDGLDALEGIRTLAKGWEPLTSTEIVQADAYHFGGEQLVPAGLERMQSDEYAKWDQLAKKTVYEYHVAKARAAAEAAGLDPDEAAEKVEAPVKEPFVPVMYL